MASQKICERQLEQLKATYDQNAFLSHTNDKISGRWNRKASDVKILSDEDYKNDN